MCNCLDSDKDKTLPTPKEMTSYVKSTRIIKGRPVTLIKPRK